MREESNASAGHVRPPSAQVGAVPPLWRRAWEGWKRIAEAIGNFNARVLLTLFYLVIVGPIAFGVKLLSDPLRLKRSSSSYWSPIASPPDGVDAAKRQFS